MAITILFRLMVSIVVTVKEIHFRHYSRVNTLSGSINQKRFLVLLISHIRVLPTPFTPDKRAE